MENPDGVSVKVVDRVGVVIASEVGLSVVPPRSVVAGIVMSLDCASLVEETVICAVELGSACEVVAPSLKTVPSPAVLVVGSLDKAEVPVVERLVGSVVDLMSVVLSVDGPAVNAVDVVSSVCGTIAVSTRVVLPLASVRANVAISSNGTVVTSPFTVTAVVESDCAQINGNDQRSAPMGSRLESMASMVQLCAGGGYFTKSWEMESGTAIQ